MKVMVNGAIHRRPARVEVVARYFDGLPAARRTTPELYDGEVLMEAIGSPMPTIIRVHE